MSGRKEDENNASYEHILLLNKKSFDLPNKRMDSQIEPALEPNLLNDKKNSWIVG